MTNNKIFDEIINILESKYSVTNGKFLVSEMKLNSRKYRATIRVIGERIARGAVIEFSICLPNKQIYTFDPYFEAHNSAMFESYLEDFENILETIKNIHGRIGKNIVMSNIIEESEERAIVFVNYGKSTKVYCDITINLETKRATYLKIGKIRYTGYLMLRSHEKRYKGQNINIGKVFNQYIDNNVKSNAMNGNAK